MNAIVLYNSEARTTLYSFVRWHRPILTRSLLKLNSASLRLDAILLNCNKIVKFTVLKTCTLKMLKPLTFEIAILCHLEHQVQLAHLLSPLPSIRTIIFKRKELTETIDEYSWKSMKTAIALGQQIQS